MAVSARRVPVTRAAAQPPRTNERNEPNTLKTSVISRNSCQLAKRWPIWCAPSAIAVRPNTSNRASADNAPTKTPLQDTYQGRNPSSGSIATTSSTSSLAIGFSFGCPGLTLPVLRTAEVGVQPLLVLASQRDARIELWGGLDVSLREIHVHLRLFPAHALDPFRRDQHLPAGQPVPRIDDAVADRPRLVVDEKILDMAEVSIGRLNVVAHHLAGAPEVWIRVLPVAREHVRFGIV